ncbi:hypothetical protein COF80_17030 [Bacillus toyonensis]|nr:hypothetical protein CN636_31785 [Bacillus toyonensis]PHE85087.1 hypothetical protein COF80_17030 [Bacillus toyonensis]
MTKKVDLKSLINNLSREHTSPQHAECCGEVMIPVCWTLEVVLDLCAETFNIYLLEATCAPCDCFVECVNVDLKVGVIDFIVTLPLTAHATVCIDPFSLCTTNCYVNNVTC